MKLCLRCWRVVYIYIYIYNFFFFYSNIRKKKKEKITKDDHFLFLNLIEEIKCETVRMLSNIRWKAAHLATRCALRLAHLDILRALQTFMKCNWTTKLEITGAEIQYETSKRSFKARIVKIESPTMIREEQPIETTILKANKVALGFTHQGIHRG